MADETLSFSIIARDQASGAFRETARSASDLAGKMDIAARTGRVLDETLRKEVRAGDELSKSFGVSAKAADILARAERRLAEDALGAKEELRGVKYEADRLDGTTADVHVKVKVDRSELSRARADLGGSSGGGRGGILGSILGFGTGGGGGGGGGLSSLLSGGLTSPVGIGAAGLGAALLGPGVIGAGLGGAVGLGAIGGGLLGASQGDKILKADTANIKQITTGLKTAIGQQKQQLSQALVAANKQYAKDSAFYAPFDALKNSLKGFTQDILAPLRPVMEPLSKIIAGFGKGLKDLSPQLTGLFKASLPFIQQFAQVMLQSGKILIPAFTQALTEMVKSGALKLMTQGLVILVQGLARFTVALGPGMKASAQIFVDVSKIIALTLQGIGKAASWLANVFNDYFHIVRERLKEWRTDWDGARHMIATVFDGIRHDIAAAWNATWNNTIGRLQRGVADDQKLMGQLRHDIASVFDGIRHDIASAWDTIWQNTVTRVQNGIADVIRWFRGLPGRAVGALTGLGHTLASFASQAMGEMWSGFKNVGGAIVSWVKGFGSSIINGLKHVFGIASPSSVFHGIGENLMHGLLNGLKAGHGKVGNFLQSTVSKSVLGGVTGAFGASAATAQRYASSLLSMYGWSQSQMGSLIPLWNQESGWNAYAVNPSSGAYGIPQSLGHGHPYNLGDYKNQVIWGLNYIRQRYGSPAGAWAHEQAFNWYASGTASAAPGWAVVGERGPELVRFRGGEQVVPGGPGGGGTVININVSVPVSANPADVGRQLADLLKSYTKRGGTLYPAGVTPR